MIELARLTATLMITRLCTFCLLMTALLLPPLNHAWGTMPAQAEFSPFRELSLSHSMHDAARKDQLANNERSASERAAHSKEQPESPSRIEAGYEKRIIEPLSQFGYDIFDHMAPEDFSRPAGAVQKDFRLSVGDRLTVVQRGQVNREQTAEIDHAGRLILEDMRPVAAAGLTLGQVEEILESRLAGTYNSEIFLTLDGVHQASILVAGHVQKPGRHTLTVFHSVLDALSSAGGVEKSGSLRQIKLLRDGRTMAIDLYSLLVYGTDFTDMALKDGDRIIVPPIGPTVAVAGAVARPGIYELRRHIQNKLYKPQAEAERLSLQDMLLLGGGVLQAGQNRFLQLGLSADGEDVIQEIDQPHARLFGPGAILMVSPSEEKRTGSIELRGHIRQKGVHALRDNPSLAAVLEEKSILGPDIYPLIALIERRDQKHLSPLLIPFSPSAVIQGHRDRQLKDGDILHFFARTDMLALTHDGPAERPPPAQAQPDHAADTEQDFAYGSRTETSVTDAAFDQRPPLEIRRFLEDHRAFIRGAVHRPGGWPVSDDTSLAQIIAVAGGMSLGADARTIEITARQGQEARKVRQVYDLKEINPEDIILAPGDTVQVRQRFQQASDHTVLVAGAVRNPGRFDLMPGETLSQLLARAGGLTRTAYPEGAIFSRESERRREEARFHAQAQELEIRLASSLEQKDRPDMAEIQTVQDLIAQLKQAEALGRLTVEADPGLLKARPELDILMEAGDRIFIPQRPLTVRVAGEVLSPSSLQFREDKDARDYLMEAGGFSYHADKGRTFVLYPDGSAQPLHVDNWNHRPAMIPPGSTIFVPRDPKPFDFIETARDVTQILSNLAVTGIFIDDIRDN